MNNATPLAYTVTPSSHPRSTEQRAALLQRGHRAGTALNSQFSGKKKTLTCSVQTARGIHTWCLHTVHGDSITPCGSPHAVGCLHT